MWWKTTPKEGPHANSQQEECPGNQATWGAFVDIPRTGTVVEARFLCRSEAAPGRFRKWSVTYRIGSVPYFGAVSTPVRPVAEVNRDLTIGQRQHPWKRRWGIFFASFSTFSRLSQFALLLIRREFWLELTRGDRARDQTEMVEFIALSFPYSSNLKIWSFHVVVVQGQQRNV